MSQNAMRTAIENALRAELATDGDTGSANAQISRLADAIATAVATHVTAELNVLRTLLLTPGAFTVVVPPGTPSPTTPAAISAYNPGIPWKRILIDHGKAFF